MPSEGHVVGRGLGVRSSGFLLPFGTVELENGLCDALPDSVLDTVLLVLSAAELAFDLNVSALAK